MRISTSAAALLACSLLSGCTSNGVQGPDQEVSFDGPLRVGGGGGGSGLYPPPGNKPWSGTFGALTLCVTSPSTATITRVDPDTSSNGQPVRAVVRRVTRAGVAAGLTPVGSSKGTPEDLFGGESGQSLTTANTVDVSLPCGKDGGEQVAVEHGFDELMIVLSTAGEGTFIKKVRVHYEVDGRPFVATGEWAFSLCDRRKRCPGLDIAVP